MVAISVNGKSIDLSKGTYSNGAGLAEFGQNYFFSNNGSVIFQSSAFLNIPLSPNTNITDAIDGGGGTNTVIYQGSYADYFILRNADSTYQVSSAKTRVGPDTLKNVQLLQFSDAQAVPLNAGWNLIGNSTNTPLNAATTFSDTGKIATVWKWVASKGQWAFFSPSMSAQALSSYAAGKGYEVLTAINAGEGFWVNTLTANAQQLPPGAAVPATAFQATGSTALGKGWNLVSTSDTTTPSQFVASVGGNVSSIWAYDNPTGKWYFYAPSLAAKGGTALTDFITANGYLDFTTAGKSLGAGVGFWVNM